MNTSIAPLEKSLVYTGTQVNYYFVCQRKLWLFSHDLQMETGSDLVGLGKVIAETSYPRLHKEIMIDDRIRVDFIGKNRVIHEVKKSKKLEQAHLYQLLYYIYYLRQKGVADLTGELDYPLLKKKVKVELTPEREKELQGVLTSIGEILAQDEPPTKQKRGYCRKCSYYELCWC